MKKKKYITKISFLILIFVTSCSSKNFPKNRYPIITSTISRETENPVKDFATIELLSEEELILPTAQLTQPHPKLQTEEPPLAMDDNLEQNRYIPSVQKDQSETQAIIQPTLVTTPISPSRGDQIQWTHLSTEFGDLPPTGASIEQTASLILDIDQDGVNDFVVGVRSAPGPSLVWYRKITQGWKVYRIEDERLTIEAGGAFSDIDKDGDLDIVMGGDSSSNQVWWWENPYPNYSSEVNWIRREIKRSGSAKHHDMIFGDFDGDKKDELVFWNQGARKLYLAEIPEDPKIDQTWQMVEIFTWSSGREFEGLASFDINNDGIVDIVGGGRWFQYAENGEFVVNVIDDSQRFTRIAVGDLVDGGSPEVVFAPGDENGKLNIYEWDGQTWNKRELLDYDLDHAHSLAVEDINSDGKLDIFTAEMRLDGGNEDAKMVLLLGNGKGDFSVRYIALGFGNHESKIGDLDGNGTLDILGKPYNWETPRIDVWLNESVVLGLDEWNRQVIDAEKPWRSIFIDAADINRDGWNDIVTGGWWYENPTNSEEAWQRNDIGPSFNNFAIALDVDEDNLIDLLGTKGVGSEENAELIWARNNGGGHFDLFETPGSGNGDFLQGIAAGKFTSSERIEIALSWHAYGKGVQLVTVPVSPQDEFWNWSVLSTDSQNEALSVGDIDRDGNLDLYLGTKWLCNQGESWKLYTVYITNESPDRNILTDINADGKLDGVVGFEAVNMPGKLAWYEQGLDAKGPWKEHLIDYLIGPMSVDVADMDGDMDLDIVVGEHNTNQPELANLYVYENVDGFGEEWYQHLIFTGDEHHDGTKIVDIDQDGDFDVISIGWTSEDVILYENLSLKSFFVND